jgi:hypothetical protein
MITNANGTPWVALHTGGPRYEYQATLHAVGEELPVTLDGGWELVSSSLHDGAWEGEPRKGFTYTPGAGRWQGEWIGSPFTWVLASWRRRRAT